MLIIADFISSRLKPAFTTPKELARQGEEIRQLTGNFLKCFKKLLMKVHFLPKQVFNVDETECQGGKVDARLYNSKG